MSWQPVVLETPGLTGGPGMPPPSGRRPNWCRLRRPWGRRRGVRCWRSGRPGPAGVPITDARNGARTVSSTHGVSVIPPAAGGRCAVAPGVPRVTRHGIDGGRGRIRAGGLRLRFGREVSGGDRAFGTRTRKARRGEPDLVRRGGRPAAWRRRRPQLGGLRLCADDDRAPLPGARGDRTRPRSRRVERHQAARRADRAVQGRRARP